MAAPLHPYTQALLSAEPEPVPAHLRNKQRIILKGEIPSALDAADGLPLPYALPASRWRSARRATRSGASSRRAALSACHFAGRSAAVPVEATADANACSEVRVRNAARL